MIWRKGAKVAAVCTAAAAVLAGAWYAQEKPADAADHNDPSGRVMIGNPTDIGDLYAWHDATGTTLTVVLTFGGPLAPVAGQAGAFDPDALYGIHIDNTADNDANIDIWVRFAQNDLGDWGMQVINLPGEGEALIGAVETELTAPNGAKAWAGLRDDPFFFDLAGFQDTLATGTLSFMASRDFFAGSNITAIVLEMPVTAALGAGNSLNIWATTSTL